MLRTVNRQLFSDLGSILDEDAASDIDGPEMNDCSSSDEEDGDPDLGDFSKFLVLKLSY